MSPIYDRRVPAAVSFRLGLEGVERRSLPAAPQALFRPDGLWVWGATPETMIYNIKIGGQTQFLISSAPIPALFFEAGMSFADFNSLLGKDDGTDLRVMASLPQSNPHQKIDCFTVEIGNQIEIDVQGPLTHVVMWGLTIR